MSEILSTTKQNATRTALFGAAAVYRAVRIYLATGYSVNTAYTPANMIRASERYTGQPVAGRGKAGLRHAADNLQMFLLSHGWEAED